MLTNSLAHASEGHSPGKEVSSNVKDDHHALVHPFLAHMGMPDSPGEVSVRLNAIEQRESGARAGTAGFHLEAGVFDRLGLHLRNDGVAISSKTEMMLQHAIYRSDYGISGISLIGEIEFPTGATTDKKNEYLFGISFAYTWDAILSVNSVIHYSPEEKMTGWEIAFVTKLTEKIFPVLEFRGESGAGMSKTNGLFAWKFKITSDNSIGLGYQVPLTTSRDYDSQLIAQAEFNFK